MQKQVKKSKKVTIKSPKVVKTKKKSQQPQKQKSSHSPKYSSIYTKVDEIMDKTPEPKISKIDNPLALPVTVLPPNIPSRRVLGVSFTDYAEHKYLGADGIHDPWIQKSQHVNIPKHYTPYLRTEPVNVIINNNGELKAKPFTAAQVAKFGRIGDEPEFVIFEGAIKSTGRTQKKIIWPKYYQNPYQYQDFIYLQDIYANSIAGRIIDAVTYFILANGVRPRIRVKNENKYKNDEAKRKFLDEHKWMVDELEEIDKNVSTSSQPKAFGEDTPQDIPNVGPMGTAKDKDTATYDTSLQKKWKATCVMALTFGRACIVPRVDPDDNKVTVNAGSKDEFTYKNIPKIILPIHTRDMGFNYVDYMTHRLLGIQLNNSNWILTPDEMQFWENKPDNPVYGSKYYGMSEMQSMMGSARTIRQIIEVDLPLIAKTRWSGMYWIVFKRKFEDAGTSDAEATAILANIELNGINISMEDNPEEDFKLHKIDLDPKIAELLQSVKDMIQYMQGQVGLPQGILYGEQDLNRDTLSKKISTWDKSYIKDKRKWFLEPISGWYIRLGKTLEKQAEKWKKALTEIEVYADVEPLRLEDLQNQIQIMMMMENITGAWKDEAREDFLDMEGLSGMVDPKKSVEDIPPLPSGMGKQGMTVTENGSNRSFGVQNNG